MTAFLLVAAGLTVMSLLALGPALLSAAAPRPAWRTTAALALVLPMAAGGLYRQFGTPEALAAPKPAVSSNPVRQMVQRLADRLQRIPDDADGWALLARAYEQLDRPQDALPAYEQLERLRPDDAQALSEHAVTLAMVKGGRLAGEPQALLKRALAVDPRHVPALALLAAAAQEQADMAAARALWTRVLAEAPRDSDIARQARESLRRLEGAQ